MKPIAQLLLVSLLSLTLANNSSAADWTRSMKEGKPAFKSMGPIAFGPEGILLIADTQGAAVVAIATGDTKPAADAKPLKVEGINQKIAALVGSAPDQVLINDLAVNPISRNAYLAVSRGRGPDAIRVLVRVKASGSPELVSLDKVKYSRAELPDAAVEVLTPDFRGNREAIRMVVEAKPDYYNHNVETVPRLYDFVRPGSRFERSLSVLREATRLDPEIEARISRRASALCGPHRASKLIASRGSECEPKIASLDRNN